MSEIKFEVKPLFVEPLMEADIGHAITPEQVNFIKSLKMLPNRTNLISDDLYIFERPELKSIRNAVQKTLDLYAREVLGLPAGQRLYVTQSWALMNEPGAGMHGHTHSNSIVSGSLYFTDLPQPESGMIFNRHREYQQIELTPDNTRRSLYNTPMHLIQPRKNTVLLFSSSLQHLVAPNTGSGPRWSVAFNTFIKGKIGSFRDVSELSL